jgi:hypothetical protein
MKLTELYLDEIRRHLPPKNREDILKEIHSTLIDMIEDRNPYPGQTPEDELVKSVLQEFGAPREVAQQYTEHNFLIGPRMYPLYLQVLKIVLIVIAGLNVFGIIMTIINASGLSNNLFEAIAQLLGGIFSSLFTGFGIVTLVFASIERTSPEEWKVKIGKDWTPDDLLTQEDRKSIKVIELAFEITFTLIFIVLLNFFLDRIGIYYLDENRWVSAPILNDNFLRYVPWLTAANVLSIALNLFLIRQGYWDKRATIAKLLINAFTIVINFATIIGPEVITITSTAWQKLNFDITATAQEVSRGMNIGLDILLGLSIFGVVVESIKMIYTHFIKGSHAYVEISVD